MDYVGIQTEFVSPIILQKKLKTTNSENEKVYQAKR